MSSDEGSDELDDHVVTRFGECSPEMIQDIRYCFQLWGKVELDNPDQLTDAQLEEHVDSMIFATWASDEDITTPIFVAPRVQDYYVRVGVFNENLPSLKDIEAIISEGFEYDQVIDSPRHQKYYDRNLPPKHRAGQPAFMRAKLDSLEESIVHEFFDKKGAPAPCSYVNFGTNDFELPDSKRCQAYKTADAA